MYVLSVKIMLLTCIMMSWAMQSYAIEIVIGEGVEQALPVAVADFDGVAGVEVAAVIRNDLRRSGHFQVLEVADMPANPAAVAEVDLADWRRTGVENLLLGEVQQQEGGYQLRYYLVDVYKQAQIAAERINSDDWRLAAHRVSDNVLVALTGYEGAIFSQRMVFTSASGGSESGGYLLSVSDYDGYDARVLLDSAEPILSPTFSPDGRSLSYVAFEGGGTAIYIQNLASGRRQRVSAWPGLNSAPAYSPDGTSIAASLSRDGNPEIYILQLASATWQRLTNSHAIDTEPVWMPDGKSLMFTSDRSGKPQIYRVYIDTGEIARVSFGTDYNANPAVSPDGSTMVTITAAGNSFKLAVFAIATGELLRTISTIVSPETVDFSGNGQLLLYSSGNRIGTVPLQGRPDIPVNIPGALNPRQASWGRR